ATTGCGQASPIPPGSSANMTISSHPAESEGEHTRTYRVHIPKAYDTHIPLAVVLVFHGYSGNAAGMESSTGFSQLADQQHFIAVYPQGLPDGEGGKPIWASIGPFDYGIDDALFVSDMLNDLQSKLCIDAHRIYVTGSSNGGGMSGFLACRLARRIAAFAPISGNFYAIPDGCHPGRAVSILNIHGTKDPILPYTGIPASVNPQWPLPSIPQWLQEWARQDSCTNGPKTFLQKSSVTGEQWTDCKGNATVVHYRIEGGGHSWPSAIGGQSAANVIWLFLQNHPLPKT
ncbi:MAG: ferulic acid esterase, partial [Chloroflexota bacterium]|nr:ferulic acid esterase [Chloroflexota bacterium]